MEYSKLSKVQKKLFVTINGENSYRELVEFCIKWLKGNSKYDATSEGLKLFMKKHDIFCSLPEPSKKSLILTTIKMLEIDRSPYKQLSVVTDKDYVKLCKQDGRDVVIHKDDVKNYLEQCFIDS